MREVPQKSREELECEVARIAAETFSGDPWTHPNQTRIFLEAVRLLLDLRRTRDTFPSIWPQRSSGSSDG